MSSRRGTTTHDATEDSIEARGSDEDVEMKDRDGDGDDQNGSDVDDDGEEGDSHDMLQNIKKLSAYLCKVEEDGAELAAGFQRIPNRRMLPDYFEVISEPVAFSTIRGKIQKKLYNAFSEFVRDVALICHNAQVYNRPSAPIFGAAVRLREIFKEELQKLVDKNIISTEEARIPDLGELPPVEESPSVASEMDIGDDEEEEEDEEEDEDDDSDEDGGRRRRRGRGRASLSSRRDREAEKDDEAHKKRGRPPSVLTPMEARISAILKGLRKLKDTDGNLLILPFERLPDKAAVPDYYTTITSPIALDHIKKRAKRKKYKNVDHVMADIEQMFENAKLYNEDESHVHQSAVELQQHARTLAAHEKARPDDDFRDEDGKLALADIQYKGEAWRVGDWVHIRNPNDLAKPIIAQIYRTWQDPAGQKWINACWYYRPEQTVHRFEKHFFDHEVVKTGQYRDHQIEDVLDRCFVMFVTRFHRGRPRGLPADKEVYICESRYNEQNFTFNKIKTWASCVPDEVREKDYEMDLFEAPRRLKKLPSPIKHLLREDAKETDDLPKPTWGSPNAPPIVGAVHRRPREANESPPPEPTPPPSRASAMPDMPSERARRSSMLAMGREPSSEIMGRPSPMPYAGPGPSSSPSQFNAHMAPRFAPATPGSVPPGHQTPVPIPQPPQHGAPNPAMGSRPMQYHQGGFQQGYSQGYAHSPPTGHHQTMANPLSAPYSHSPAPPQPQRMPTGQAVGGNAYNPPRPPEVYTLPDNLNGVLPEDIRQGFKHDDAGRMLFFTVPPLDRSHKGISRESAALGHSVRYLAGRQEWLAQRDKKRKERDEKLQERVSKRGSPGSEATDDEQLVSQALGAMDNWFKRYDDDTKVWEKEAGLSGWRVSYGARNTT